MADLLKFAFSSAKHSDQFVLRPLKEPFLCQDEVDHSIASWRLLGWIRFQHLFATAPAYLSRHYSVPGTQISDAEGGPFKSSPNARIWRRFWYRPLCSAVAMWEMSIFAMWSRYRSKASVHPWVILGLLFFVNRLPICHDIDAYSRLFFFEQPFTASLALAWCTLRCRLNGRLYF